MYSLNCDWYKDEWETIDQLIDDFISRDIMNVNVLITINGELTEQRVCDYLPF